MTEARPDAIMSGETSTPAPAPGGRRLRAVMKRLAVSVAFIYVAVCVGMFSIQSWLIYYPQKAYWATPDQLGLAFEDVTLTTDDGVTIHGWYMPRAAAKGTIVYFHGNAVNIGQECPTHKLWHSMGYNVFAVDYRGYGRSAGAPSEQGTYRDADAAWKHLTRQRGESPERIVLFGRSLGSAVAIDLAVRERPGALVIEAAFTSIVDIGQRQYPFLPIGLLCRYRYDSVRKIPRVTCPILFFHGTDDELVPLVDARRLYDAAVAPKEFVETPGGHNDSGFEYSAWYTQRLGEWLDRALAR